MLIIGENRRKSSVTDRRSDRQTRCKGGLVRFVVSASRQSVRCLREGRVAFSLLAGLCLTRSATR